MDSFTNDKIQGHLDLLLTRYPVLSDCRQEIINAYQIMEACYLHDGKVLIAGNGGSAADSEHIVGELMKGFKLPRPVDRLFSAKLRDVDGKMGAVLSENLQGALTAIALGGHLALSTAYMNDCEPLLCFAQQVLGYGRQGDVFFGISTSGTSQNILYAATVAKAQGMKVIGLTGIRESRLSEIADVCVRVPQRETFMVQELHLPVYHCLCLMLEEKFFGGQEA